VGGGGHDPPVGTCVFRMGGGGSAAPPQYRRRGVSPRVRGTSEAPKEYDKRHSSGGNRCQGIRDHQMMHSHAYLSAENPNTENKKAVGGGGGVHRVGGGGAEPPLREPSEQGWVGGGGVNPPPCPKQNTPHGASIK
jgi:hypothetical protein